MGSKWEDRIMGVVFIATFLLIIWFGYLILRTYQECASRGGQMVGTGRYTTTLVLVGKVLVPTRTEISECRIVER